MKTFLYDRHVSLGAKMITFSGWEMPLSYQGVIAEHQAVREKVGLFDVSHMGCIHIKGADAGRLLEYLSTNRIKEKEAGSAIYTVWCHAHGGSVDDVIIYKIGDNDYFFIANASNREKDLIHLQTQSQIQGFDIVIKEKFENYGILSLQGPFSFPLVFSLFPEAEALKPMHFISVSEKEDLFISRTGYTGAGGFELYGPADKIVEWWDVFLDKGKPYGIQPVGLGARDTLRLEMGFALYGHELTDTIAPNESVSAWTIKWDKTDFLGKEPLILIEESANKRWPYAIRLLEKGIARQENRVLKDGVDIGEVTSGSFSPTLNAGIALVLVSTPLKLGDKVSVKIRENICYAEVVKLPFVRKAA